MENKQIEYIGCIKSDKLAYYDNLKESYLVSQGYRNIRNATQKEIMHIKAKFGDLEKITFN